MSLSGFFSRFVPSDHRFFAHFDAVMDNLVTAAGVLGQLVRTETQEEREPIVERIRELEHEGDTLTHRIFSDLNATFVTPFDREDIHKLASALDDILDHVDESARKIVLYQLKKIPDPVVNLADIIDRSVRELQQAVRMLKSLKNTAEMQSTVERLNEYENEADDVFERAVAALFEKEKDNPVRLIKVKEVLIALELATDECEDAGNVLESILIKHA